MKARWWWFWSEFGYCLLIFLETILILCVHSVGLPLNDFITHFEPLYYDNEQLRNIHQRIRRSPSSDYIKLQFFAHNRHFKMKLRTDNSIFAADVQFESSEGPLNFDISRTLIGSLEDDEKSVVRGVLTSEGLFDGVINAVCGDEFYIEPSSRYLSPDYDFHSVIYRAADIKMPKFNVTCHSEILHKKCSSLHRIKRASGEVDSGGRLLHRRHHPSPRVIIHDRSHVGASAVNDHDDNYVDDNDDDYQHDKASDGLHFAVISDSSAEESNANSALEKEHSLINFDIDIANNDYAKHVIIDESTKPLFFGNIPLKDEILLLEKLKANQLNTARHRTRNEKLHGSRMTADKTSRRKHHKNGDDRSASSQLPGFNVIHKHSKLYSMPYENKMPDLPKGPAMNRLEQAESLQQKRAAIDPKKTTCMLYLQADHLFFQRLGSIEACIESMTRHVQKVNNIYRVTDFDQDGRPDNISFMIKRIKVHTLEAMRDSNYRFPGNYGVEKFLEIFSEEDYDAFCLAYMFTYRDFEGGTLGLAWTGDLKNAGGVCEKNGHYRGSLKSLNTGIVTLLNYGKHVPPAVSHVTLAHEIGHNFGSPHDPEDNRACTPGGEDGNYIMFARATSGDKRNNNKFSPCSLNNINLVLNTKARGNKGCFTEPQDSICGNEVVEKGEECDCGWEEDCKEMCCFPMKANPPKHEPPCKLKPNKTCSPSQGPCCGPECKLQIGTKCREDNGCRNSSYCDGLGPKCPPSNNKPNKTVCNDEFVCFMGECTGSICIAYGLESCQCRRELHDPVTKACELCCKLPGEDQPCLSSFKWNHPPYDIPDMYAKPGTPCDNYNGYCDMFQKCREVDPSGPLATLRKLLLSTESIASLKRWLVDHWWGVLFITIGFVIILIIIVKVFGKNPDLKMKVMTAAGQFPGSNNPAFTTAPQHAITTAVSRTNLPVTTTTTGIANGRPFGMAPNGWV